MKTREIALAITFAAVAIALTAIKIPTLFYPGGFFRFSQIPILVAFLLFGLRSGVLIGFVTLMGQITVFPTSASAIFIAYPTEFLSLLFMFAGMYSSNMIIKSNESSRYFLIRNAATRLTVFAVLFRGGIMPLFDYFVVFHVLVPLVVQITPLESYIVGLVPSFVAYNLIVPLYSVPAAYFIAKRASRSLDMHPVNLA